MTGENERDETTRSASRDRPSRQILQYRILDSIGSGGMGQVFLAQDTRLDRLVALKTLSSMHSAEGKERERIFAEARAAARLSHPNICAIHAIEETADTVFIVMEYVQGKTLNQLMANHPLGSGQLVDLAIQCCQGLGAAHEQRLLHRDIKLSNIMVNQRGLLKIMDFGLAQMFTSEAQLHTKDIAGTYQYMSPEQIIGEPLGVPSDIFSLGVVLYKLSSGHLPFKGEDRAALTYSIVHDEPPSLGHLRPDLPRQWETIILKALKKEQSQRFASVEEMLSQLTSTVPLDPLRTPTTQSTHSVAIFPFRQLKEDPETEYIADGICEDVITKLTRVKSLRVASRSAVFRFKDKTYDPIDIGERLKVNAVLEGSIRKEGDQIRISVQLTRVDDQVCIWSDTFDRTLADLLHLQSDVAERVAAALGLNLTGSRTKPLIPPTPATHRAYDLTLRGKFFLKRRDHTSLQKAIDLLTDAVQEDPQYAAAHAQLAIAYNLFLSYGFGPADKLCGPAESLASKAVDLDPSSADAHIALFFTRRRQSPAKSIAQLKVALALDPGSYEAHHYLAHTYLFLGQYESAAEEERQARQQDPFQDISGALLGRIHFLSGDVVRAEATLDNMLTEGHSTHLIHTTRGWMNWCLRQWAEAISELELALAEESADYHLLDYLADCYGRLGQHDEALAHIETGLKDNPRSYHLLARKGQVHLRRDETAQAEEQFTRAQQLMRTFIPSWLQEQSAVFHYNQAWLWALQGRLNEASHEMTLSIQYGFGNYGDLLLRPDWDALCDHPIFANLTTDLRARIRENELLT